MKIFLRLITALHTVHKNIQEYWEQANWYKIITAHNNTQHPNLIIFYCFSTSVIVTISAEIDNGKSNVRTWYETRSVVFSFRDNDLLSSSFFVTDKLLCAKTGKGKKKKELLHVRTLITIESKPSKEDFLPTVLWERNDVTFIDDTSDTIVVLVT